MALSPYELPITTRSLPKFFSESLSACVHVVFTVSHVIPALAIWGEFKLHSETRLSIHDNEANATDTISDGKV